MKPNYLIVPQLGAVIFLGLLSGFFAAFSLDVTPALQQLDATTYAQAQQHLNQTISNRGFAVLFFGATLLPFLSAAMAAWQSRRRMALYWLIVAIIHFIGVYWISVVMSIPLHQEMLTWNAAMPPSDWQTTRDSWANSNVFRTIAESVCFISALGLVMVHDKIAVQPAYRMRQLH